MKIQEIVAKYGRDNILILDLDHSEDRFAISEGKEDKIELRSPRNSVRYRISDFNQLIKQGLIKIFVNISILKDADTSVVTSGGVSWEQPSELFKSQECSDPVSAGER